MDKDIIVEHRSHLLGHGMNFVANIPTVFHCHHFNLFWDQTIDDALGHELSCRIRTAAAREVFHDILAGLVTSAGASTPEERLELARTVFAAFGQGALTLDVSAAGGAALGRPLHYSHTWLEKYGGWIRRNTPADALAAGFAAAATEVAFGLPRESVQAVEHSCVARRDRECTFELSVGDATSVAGPMGRLQVERAMTDPVQGLLEDQVAPIEAGLREFSRGMLGDDRGLIQAFGLFATQTPSTYYNRSGYDALRHVNRTAPQSAPVMKALLREAGHVCVFSTFGGVLLSPEWEAMVGPIRGEPDEILAGSLAIARALGFGHWCAGEFEPGQRLVLQTPGGYESAYYVSREGRATEPMCFVLQGAALAIMQLIERVPWAERPTLNQEFYNQLFRNGLPWQAEETQCVSRGDPMCEVVVSRREPGNGVL
ncbi:MAG: hypothetical protein H6730_30780 [Deltaproteobacteria bacterium]|nr:hypothetical protein [Deltaproteobacteria bacterium]